MRFVRKIEPITFDLAALARLRRKCVRACYYQWNCQGRCFGSFEALRSVTYCLDVFK